MELHGDRIKAKSVSMSYMKKLINYCAFDFDNHAIFRQTVNWKLKRWNCVQRLIGNKSWRKINNEYKVINNKGWTLALWRVADIIKSIKNASGENYWNIHMFKAKHGIYSTYYLICRKRAIRK